MNNFEIIARVLSQDNADINKLKEDGFIILNTDAFRGLTFGSEKPINLEQNIVLNLFNASSTDELYSQIRRYDNKTFVLKPNGNNFTVDGIQYTITACNPCVGKIYNYNSILVLCLTFLIDTFNSQTALFKFFIFANSNTEISAKLTVENGIGGYPEVLHGKNDTTFTLTPNTFHVWDRVPSLTLDFGSKTSGVMNEYLFQFKSGTTATSLTLPADIKWVNNSAPTIVENMIYQVSIFRGGLASVLEFSDMYFNFHNYLTIEALEDNLTVTFTNDIEYGIDGKGWVKLNTGDETPPINVGQTLSFRGEFVPKSMEGIGVGTFTISKKCNLKGNCMSILFGDNTTDNFSLSDKTYSYVFNNLFQNCTNIVNVDSNFLPATTLARHCYDSMFNGCTSLTTAPKLPATTLASGCYYYMFKGCSSLTTAPKLPATTLEYECYYNMFQYCSSLTTAPELPATTLADNCYNWMFSSCSRLTTAPELPATTLARHCYDAMFQYCSSLTTAPELPATTLAESCYMSMFNGCSSLTTTPELPVTTLAGGCYYGMFKGCSSLTTTPELPATTLAGVCYTEMFKGCTSLTTAPELPVTTLAVNCYDGMFSGCTSLTTAPKLPANTLASRCYRQMFSGCTSLTTAPELPATTLADYCYMSMFNGCTKLNYIKMLATDISATNCLSDWVNSVSSTGTFIKNAAMTSLPTGNSGIPSGWAVQDAQ